MQTSMMFRALPMAGVMVVAVAAGAWGQSLTAVRAEIPFDFAVRGKILKAGTYRFEGTSFVNVIAIGGANGHLLQMLPGIPVGNPNTEGQPRIVFLKQGGTYTLSQVWMRGGGSGHQLPTPRREPGHVHVALNLSR